MLIAAVKMERSDVKISGWWSKAMLFGERYARVIYRAILTSEDVIKIFKKASRLKFHSQAACLYLCCFQNLQAGLVHCIPARLHGACPT